MNVKEQHPREDLRDGYMHGDAPLNGGFEPYVPLNLKARTEIVQNKRRTAPIRQRDPGICGVLVVD